MESAVENQISNVNDLKKVILQKMNGKGVANTIAKNLGEKDLVTKVLRIMLLNELELKMIDEPSHQKHLLGCSDTFRVSPDSTPCVRVFMNKTTSALSETLAHRYYSKRELKRGCAPGKGLERNEHGMKEPIVDVDGQHWMIGLGFFEKGKNKGRDEDGNMIPLFPISGKIEHHFNLFLDVEKSFSREDREEMLLQYLQENVGENKKSLIFFNGIRQNLSDLASGLTLRSGIKCESLTNRDSRGRRIATLAEFKNGLTRVLVTEDCLDSEMKTVEDIDCIFNFNFPCQLLVGGDVHSPTYCNFSRYAERSELLRKVGGSRQGRIMTNIVKNDLFHITDVMSLLQGKEEEVPAILIQLSRECVHKRSESFRVSLG